MRSQLIRVQELADQDIQSMFHLIGSYFNGIEFNTFTSDLNQKNWVILIKEKYNNQLKGFTTLLTYKVEFEGEQLSIVYSGDTITDPSIWSNPILARSWIAAVNQIHQADPAQKLYWLLISGGFRTYRFLSTFWQEFYPRYDRGTPASLQKLIHCLASDLFGKFYCPDKKIVRFEHPQSLCPELAGIPPERLLDENVKFFAQVNPGYTQGDELVCLTEISVDNLTRAGRRMWFSSMVELSEIK